TQNREMVTSPYISFEQERFILLYQHSKFGVSCVLNVIATFCLLKQTPEMQSQLKYYLLYMQAIAVVNDFLFDFAVLPFVLLPVLGGYCKGFICQWVSLQDNIAMFTLLLFQVDCTIIICISVLHQAIVKGKFKNVRF
ncbi:hypothetical protein PFISCL1PPCAC_14097, partial [Pristionchus fissidentatus]